MSVNIKDLISTKLLRWLERHLEPDFEGDLSEFWAVPVPTHDPEYKAICDRNIKRLNSTSIVGHTEPKLATWLIHIRDEEGEKICIIGRDASHDVDLERISQHNFGASELNFLQKAFVITKFNIPGYKKIPGRIVLASKGEPAFEQDIDAYFPPIIVLAPLHAVADSSNVLFLRAVLATDQNSEFLHPLQNEIVEVAQAIPDNDHGWIFSQLMSAVLSCRFENCFLELYKMFEFFFPLKSISELKDSIGFMESEMNLLTHCRAKLGWSMNHQRGVRSAICYGDEDFAVVCMDRAREPKEEPERFKEKAAEKLSDFRHSLVHQDFRHIHAKVEDLERFSRSLLIFLRKAFSEYRNMMRAAGARSDAQTETDPEGSPRIFGVR